MMTFVFLILGLGLLVIGAEWLVRGSARFAAIMGIPPLAIGLTIVAFGTSAPELMVSCQAALKGQPDIAVANVVGSNIFNVLFILGISALIAPLTVHMKLIMKDVPIMIGISLLLWVQSLNGNLGVVDGLVLLAGIVGYTIFALRQSREEDASVEQEYAQEFDLKHAGGKKNTDIGKNIFLIIVGLAALVIGAKWLIDSSIEIARMVGVSELVIGLTLVAAGTSLPEVATSIMATIKGERDIAIGNVIGSNLFNILGILGVTALVSRGHLPVSPEMIRFDIPVMAAVAVACWPVFLTGKVISRVEGFLFLAGYVLYTVVLFTRASVG